eukprot:PhM_4_TR1003/c0_g1_i1/m.79608
MALYRDEFANDFANLTATDNAQITSLAQHTITAVGADTLGLSDVIDVILSNVAQQPHLLLAAVFFVDCCCVKLKGGDSAVVEQLRDAFIVSDTISTLCDLCDQRLSGAQKAQAHRVFEHWTNSAVFSTTVKPTATTTTTTESDLGLSDECLSLPGDALERREVVLRTLYNDIRQLPTARCRQVLHVLETYLPHIHTEPGLTRVKTLSDVVAREIATAEAQKHSSSTAVHSSRGGGGGARIEQFLSAQNKKMEVINVDDPSLSSVPVHRHHPTESVLQLPQLMAYTYRPPLNDNLALCESTHVATGLVPRYGHVVPERLGRAAGFARRALPTSDEWSSGFDITTLVPRDEESITGGVTKRQRDAATTD